MSNIPQGGGNNNSAYLTLQKAYSLFATPAYVHSLTDGTFVPISGGTMTGALAISPQVDSTSLLNIINQSAGTTLFKIDSTNNIIYGPSQSMKCSANGLSISSTNATAFQVYKADGSTSLFNVNTSASTLQWGTPGGGGSGVGKLYSPDSYGFYFDKYGCVNASSTSSRYWQILTSSGVPRFQIPQSGVDIASFYDNALSIENNISNGFFVKKKGNTNSLFSIDTTNGNIVFNETDGFTGSFRIQYTSIDNFKVLYDGTVSTINNTLDDGNGNATFHAALNTTYNQLGDGNGNAYFNSNNSSTTAFLLKSAGTTYLTANASHGTLFMKPTTDDTSVFQIQNNAGKQIFNVGSVTPSVKIGGTANGPTSSSMFIVYDGASTPNPIFTIDTTTPAVNINANIIPQGLFTLGGGGNRFTTVWAQTINTKSNNTSACLIANNSSQQLLLVDTFNTSVKIGGTASGPTSTTMFQVMNGAASPAAVFSVDTVNSVVKVNGNSIQSFAKTTVQYSTAAPFIFDSGNTSYLASGLSATGLTKAAITITAGGNVVVKICGYADFNAFNAGGSFKMQIQNVANNTAQATNIGVNTALATYYGSGDNGTNSAFMPFCIEQKFTGYTLSSTQYFDLILAVSVNSSINVYINYIEIVEVP